MKSSEIYNKNKKAIVLLAIIMPDGDKKKINLRGTGFIVSKNGKFITCAHVYNQIKEDERDYLVAKVMSNTDSKGITSYADYKVSFIDSDEENDIALMKIENDKNYNFEFINKFEDAEYVTEGEDVLFLGYPLGTELLVMGFGLSLLMNKCIISSVKRRALDGSLHFFMVDTHINNGSSGSPLFSQDSGKIVGLVSGRVSSKIPFKENTFIDVPANLGICKPVKYINNIINKNN